MHNGVLFIFPCLFECVLYMLRMLFTLLEFEIVVDETVCAIVYYLFVLFAKTSCLLVEVCDLH